MSGLPTNQTWLEFCVIGIVPRPVLFRKQFLCRDHGEEVVGVLALISFVDLVLALDVAELDKDSDSMLAGKRSGSGPRVSEAGLPVPGIEVSLNSQQHEDDDIQHAGESEHKCRAMNWQ